MKCVHQDMPNRPRPRTIVTFSEEEVAEALHNYAAKGMRMPTGAMYVWGREHGRGIQLVIEREEGQEVWPPEAVNDGG